MRWKEIIVQFYIHVLRIHKVIKRSSFFNIYWNLVKKNLGWHRQIYFEAVASLSSAGGSSISLQIASILFLFSWAFPLFAARITRN